MYPPVGLLVVDFDDTITQHDALSLLIDTCPRMQDSCKNECPPPWSYFTELFFKERADHVQLWLKSHPHETIDDYFKLLGSIEKVEEKSIKRIEKYNCLSGVHVAQLIQQGSKIKKRPGTAEVLKRFLAKNSPGSLYVISANWSRDLILGCLQEVDGINRNVIMSNDLIFVESFSTGKLERKVLSALDKLEIFKSLTVPPGKLSVYVGDSENDLPCILAADIGIIMGNNVSLMRTCKKYGIEIIDGLSGKQLIQVSEDKNALGSSKKLYRVQDWLEIKKSGILE
ncbi:hypothetical protein G9A89_023328 [Geosiphon pyriformis]|nr:hypothetical protein G9A89_023328 [Geosiphon pyriformis]